MKEKKWIGELLTGVLLVVFCVSAVHAAVPERINYQGYLTDKSGNSVTTPVSITVSIYTGPTGGTPFWTETHNNVIPENGVYNIVLGSLNPLYIDHSVYDLFYLGVKVGSDAEMTPRQEVTSVGSAHTAWTALNLVCTNCVSASEVDTTTIQRRVTGTCAAGSSIRMIDQNGTVTCETDDGITAETDPQVGVVTAGKWCTGDGAAVQCSQNPPVLSESDPQVGTLTPNLWCVSNSGGTAINCTQTSPAANAWSLTGNAGTTPGTNFIGTTDNKALEVKVNNTRALRIEPNAISPNILGGYSGNFLAAGVIGATIGGGGNNDDLNAVTDNYGTVGGGIQNNAGNNAGTTDDSAYATVGGGVNNWATGGAATVGGGSSNQVSGYAATVGGGLQNVANAKFATICGGGPANEADPDSSRNRITDDYGTIGGGGNNQAGNNTGTTSDATYATVGGGVDNDASGPAATVGGGGENIASGGNATVGGGRENIASGSNSAVGGGGINHASGPSSTVGGGGQNSATSDYSTVGGGYNNTAGYYSSVTGGFSNAASAAYSTVGGGTFNTTSGDASIVSGGSNNTASGYISTVSGGMYNTASGLHATVPGGRSNSAQGFYSFAAGYRAKAAGNGSFVWGDSNDVDIYAWGTNEFVVRATGGFWFITAVDATGFPTEGMQLPAGTSQWVPIGATTAATAASVYLSTDDDYTEKIGKENTALKQRIDDLESRLAALEYLVASMQSGR